MTVLTRLKGRSGWPTSNSLFATKRRTKGGSSCRSSIGRGESFGRTRQRRTDVHHNRLDFRQKLENNPLLFSL